MTNFRRIDIHAHVNFPEFDADRDEVIKRALDAGTALLNVGTDIKTSKSAIELAHKYEDGVFATVGLHPTNFSESIDKDSYKNMLADPKVVGIGECGLDYFHLGDESKLSQKKVFTEQIELANETGKSMMLHIRDAYDDALDIIRANAKIKGDVHFFAGSVDQARKFLDLGFTLSFTGVITFAKQYEELVKFVPLDMIQAETDCPYVAPVPHRGKRNEPSYVSFVVDKIAAIKNLPLAEVEEALMRNAERVWGVSLNK